MSETSKLGVGTAVAVAVLLVLFGVVVASRRPRGTATPAGPQPVSMADSRAAMRQAGEAMKAHGQEMLYEWKRTGDAKLAAEGEQWLRDSDALIAGGDALIAGGDWMSEDPTAPGNLHAPQHPTRAGQLARTQQARSGDGA